MMLASEYLLCQNIRLAIHCWYNA